MKLKIKKHINNTIGISRYTMAKFVLDYIINSPLSGKVSSCDVGLYLKSITLGSSTTNSNSNDINNYIDK